MLNQRVVYVFHFFVGRYFKICESIIKHAINNFVFSLERTGEVLFAIKSFDF